MGFLALLWFSEICQFSHRFSGPWEYSSSSVFFSKTTPFLRCTLCVCLLCGCGRRMSRHRKGGSSGWWRCKASPWFCFGALWAWGLALVDSELLLLITGSDWSATCVFRGHGIQEIGLPPARWGASPTCRWPHTSATPTMCQRSRVNFTQIVSDVVF